MTGEGGRNIERPDARASTARWQTYADAQEAEAERLRAEWRKSDDGRIAAEEQLRGAVEALRKVDPQVDHYGKPVVSRGWVTVYMKPDVWATLNRLRGQ